MRKTAESRVIGAMLTALKDGFSFSSATLGDVAKAVVTTMGYEDSPQADQDPQAALNCYWSANCGLWEAAMTADATTLEDEYAHMGGVWTIDPPFVDDVYHPTADLIECADGRKRTAAERAAWLDAIHASIRDAATS